VTDREAFFVLFYQTIDLYHNSSRDSNPHITLTHTITHCLTLLLLYTFYIIYHDAPHLLAIPTTKLRDTARERDIPTFLFLFTTTAPVYIHRPISFRLSLSPRVSPLHLLTPTHHTSNNNPSSRLNNTLQLCCQSRSSHSFGLFHLRNDDIPSPSRLTGGDQHLISSPLHTLILCRKSFIKSCQLQL
jgi:hypothetical protein